MPNQLHIVLYTFSLVRDPSMMVIAKEENYELLEYDVFIRLSIPN